MLTDRGTEFEKCELFEVNIETGEIHGKTPYEAFEFLYGNEILNKLNIQKIEKDMVTLKPYLLKIK